MRDWGVTGDSPKVLPIANWKSKKAEGLKAALPGRSHGPVCPVRLQGQGRPVRLESDQERSPWFLETWAKSLQSRHIFITSHNTCNADSSNESLCPSAIRKIPGISPYGASKSLLVGDGLILFGRRFGGFLLLGHRNLLQLGLPDQLPGQIDDGPFIDLCERNMSVAALEGLGP